MASENISPKVTKAILDDFNQNQEFLNKKKLRSFLMEQYEPRGGEKTKKTTKRCGKKILKDRKRNTGLYNTIEKIG